MPFTRPLILASASPRRVELMREAGLVFDVRPSGVDEAAIVEPDHAAFAMKAALLKAKDVAARVEAG